MIGNTISHYKIIEKLGEGGMGIVYKAEDTKLRRSVALKFLPREYSSDVAAKERFVHEAQAASALDHPNICNIHEIGETEDGQSYIAMACYEGQSLQSSITNKQLSIDQSIKIFIQIAQGLQKAHQVNLVHRDVKPANIIVTHDDTVKILDFGLAKLAGQTRLTKTGSTVGTTAYMSPEQAQGEPIDQRTDIWSLGVVMYEMLTGQLPFKGDYEQAMVYSIINEKQLSVSVLNEDVSEELEEIVNKCLAKNVDKRYQTVNDLLADFKGFSKELDISFDESLPKLLNRVWRKKIVRQVTATATAILLLVTISLILWPKVTGPIPIAVSSFENLTNDPAYDYLHKVIPKLLITDLEQSRFFHVNTWERMKDLLEQAGKEDLDYIDLDVGIELCKIDNIPAIVTGSITKIGNMFSIDVKILDTDTKKIIKSAKSVGEGKNSILKSQIGQLSEQIAAAVNLPANEFAKSKKPIIDVTTNSLEAYKYHLLGFDNYHALYNKEAKENFVRAVNLDSTFAMAHIGLSFTYWKEGNFEKMNTHLELAKKYRYKLTHKEQIRLDFAYDRRKGNDYTKSMNAMKKATSLYPKEKQLFHVLGDHIFYTGDVDTAITYLKKALDLDPNFKSVLRLMGYSYMKKKDYTKAIEYLNRYIDVAPNEAGPYDSMGDIYLFMAEYEKSIEMYQKALEIKPDFGSQSGIVSNYIQMRDIQKARNYLYQWSDVTSSSEPDRFKIHYYLAVTYLAEGDLKMTLKELEKRGNLAKQISNEALLFGNYLFLSEILYENRKIKESEENLAAAKKLIGSSDFSEEQKDGVLKMYLWHSTRHAVIKGSIDQAKKFAKMYKVGLEKNENPYLIKRSYALFGLIAQAEGNYEKAIEDLKQSDLDNPFNNYQLALAYIKNGDENNAIEKLEGVVNYPGYVYLLKEMWRDRAEKQLSLLKTGD